MKLALLTFTGLVVALFSWFMLGAGPFIVFFPTKLSKSILMLAASLAQVDPISICFLAGSTGALLLVELLKEVLDGKRMLSAEK